MEQVPRGRASSTGPPGGAIGGFGSLCDRSALAACVGVRCARVGEGGLGVFNPGKPGVYSVGVLVNTVRAIGQRDVQ